MDILGNLGNGFAIALTPLNILYGLIGSHPGDGCRCVTRAGASCNDRAALAGHL